jgi:quercetin 2,3-dioxygenase
MGAYGKEPPMPEMRHITGIFKARPTSEGAGVHLKRAFGYSEAPRFDPFLLLDDFHSANPADYLAGFPWHPHRGIETITYVLSGEIEHGDSMGNSGVIGAGDVQWMTAGSGIIHQEMPKGEKSPSPDGGRMMWGFQLWANLPASQKMMEPRYREVKASQIPRIAVEGGASVGVICGAVGAVRGPVRDIVTDPEYLDVALRAGGHFAHPVPRGHSAFAYVVDGAGRFSPEQDPFAFPVSAANYFEMISGERSVVIPSENVVAFGEGDQVSVRAGDEPVRFLLVSGKPLKEPVAWGGPIVMNTQEELRLAFDEYNRGTFVKHGMR